jgi:hypothetical protein
MIAIHGHYDGKVVILDGPVAAQPEGQVLVLFRKGREATPEEARSIRRRLRGSGRGLRLIEKLLIERKRDG